MKTWFEKADLTLRVLTFLAVVIPGGWVLYQYNLAGADDWANNITLETRVLPYHDNLRLLVVHVKSKNPRNFEFELNSKQGDSFELRCRKIAADLKVNTVIDEDSGELIKKINLMQGTGDEYDYAFLPGAEMDDMRVIVLPVNITVALIAEMQIHTGTIDKHGKPDTDFISASTVVRIEP